MHTVSPLYLCTPNCRSKSIQEHIEKNQHIIGPIQFKPMLFQGQQLTLTTQDSFLLHLETETGTLSHP